MKQSFSSGIGKFVIVSTQTENVLISLMLGVMEMPELLKVVASYPLAWKTMSSLYAIILGGNYSLSYSVNLNPLQAPLKIGFLKPLQLILISELARYSSLKLIY